MAKTKGASAKDEQTIKAAGVENPVPEEGNAENLVPGGENVENAAPSEGENKGDDGEKAEDTEDEEKYLVACYPILYLSHQYKVGERLPANNPEMVQAWVGAGTAAWICNRMKAPKAKPQTAEPGISGQAAFLESEDGDNLAGKVPNTSNRKK